MELEGQALWQDKMGGIPGVPAGDLGESWPPLCSPLLPLPLAPAHPCSPRAPAWNPGWPWPRLPRPAQPSWPHQTQPHVWGWRQLTGDEEPGPLKESRLS